MKILVTGGAGFIGSHIVDAYIQAGHDVTVLDNLSSGKRQNLPAGVELIPLDIQDPNLNTYFADGRFDIVNHHAAQIDVRRSMQDPHFDASVNILGTLRLLEYARTYGVRKFIFASSGGAMYGECQAPALETDPSHPESPYGYTKASAEYYIRFYSKLHHLSYTILRYGNVYGPRQDAHGEAGVVAIFIGKLLAGEPLTVYGTGRQERDYVFVGDVVAANVAALSKGENGTCNIGTQVATSVNTLVEQVSRVHGIAATPNYAPARAGELDRSVLNNAQAQKLLGWKPAHTLEQGLQETYQYFKGVAV